METETYQIEHEVEANHWWFWGRRKLFKRHIQSLNLSRSAPILDIGSSAGTNLRMLQEMSFKNVLGLDISQLAKRFCEEKGLGRVVIGDIQSFSYKKNHFELILMTDVLEHLEDEMSALKNVHETLKKKGKLLITVPCFKSLWGPQDILSHHYRRYRKKELEKKVRAAGFDLLKSHYFNYLLFVPIFVVRKLMVMKNKVVNENTINNSFINFVLKNIFVVDCLSSQYIKPPFGVSCYIVAQKR